MSKAAELANLIGNINAGGGGVNRNVIINGAMNVAQRGTSSTGLGADADSYHTIDRFKLGAENTAGRLTMSQDSSAPEGFANSLKLACTTADTSVASGELLVLAHIIEGQNVQHFCKGTSSAKPYALSFYVKGNASATYVAELFDADNSRHVVQTFNVTTDWTRVELSYPADTTGAFNDDNGASLYLQIFLHAGTNHTSGTRPSTWASKVNANRVGSGTTSFFDSTDRTFFITGVQLEVGQNPTEFEHEPFERTLAKCQRYFYTEVDPDGSMFSLVGFTDSSGSAYIQHIHSPEMRADPTLSTTGVVTDYALRVGGNTITCNTVPTLSSTSTKFAHVHWRVASGLTTGHAVTGKHTGANDFLHWDAEL